MLHTLRLYTAAFAVGFVEGLKALFTTRTSLREIVVNTLIFGLLLPLSLLVLFIRWLFRL